MKLFRFINLNKKYLLSIPRSLYYNIRILGFSQGIRCPIFFSNTVLFQNIDGKIIFTTEKVSTGMVKFGYSTSDFFSNKSRSIISISGTIEIKGPADLGVGVRLSIGKSAKLIIGRNLWITGGTLIIVRELIEFQTNCVLSWGITIMDHDAHDIYQNGKKINSSSPILIGEHSWVGFNSIILKGSNIPYGTIVGAGSVVTNKSHKSNTIICGSPASEVKANISW